MSRSHGRQSTSKLDPFSCETEIFPYVFLEWNLEGYSDKVLYANKSDHTKAIFCIKKR